jgi:hypothetical protein
MSSLDELLGERHRRSAYSGALMNLNFALLVLTAVILALGWKHIPVLVKGVRLALDELNNHRGGGGPRLRF